MPVLDTIITKKRPAHFPPPQSRTGKRRLLFTTPRTPIHLNASITFGVLGIGKDQGISGHWLEDGHQGYGATLLTRVRRHEHSKKLPSPSTTPDRHNNQSTTSEDRKRNLCGRGKAWVMEMNYNTV